MEPLPATVRSVATLARDSNLSFLAGSIAFFAFLSVIPALLLALAFGSMIGAERSASRIIGLTQSILSSEGSAVISEALADPNGAVGASVVGGVALLWSTLKVFRAIDIAFDRIYRSEKTVSIPRQLLNATVALGAIAAGVVLLLTVQLIVGRLAPRLPQYARFVDVLVLIAGLTIVLAPLYYVMPPRRIHLREVIPGTITAVFGLVALQQGFHVYASFAGQYEAYGFIGAVLLFLLWLYFGAFILLFGAVVNAAPSS